MQIVSEGSAPLILDASPMTDGEFAAFCAQYPDYRIESTADGQIVIMPPNYTRTGAMESAILFQLELWTRSRKNGLVFGPSTGFVLPSGARRSPDAAWMPLERVRRVPDGERVRYWHMAPDFIIELKSPTDRLPQLHAKMREWIDNGVELGWLIDPETRTVWVYKEGR